MVPPRSSSPFRRQMLGDGRAHRLDGIAKNVAQVLALFALANLYLVRGRLATA
jgi:hypothetical protein